MSALTKENKMGVMPINKLLLTMSAPMMISMLIQALYNVVDSVFVSWIDETNNGLTAVSLSFPAQSLMIAVAVGTGVGVNSLLSRRLGAKDYDGANKIASHGVFLAFCSYLVFLVLGIFAVRPFLAFQTDNQAVLNDGVRYLTICMCCSFGLFFQIMYERLMQSTGKTMYIMFCQGLGAIINIILDPVFIFVFKLGVAGAAIATVIGQICAMLLAIVLHHTRNKEVYINYREFKPHFLTVKLIYAIALPSIVMQSIGSVMVFLLNKILMSFQNVGEIAVSVFGVYFKLQSFVFMPILGLNNGMVPIISYNYGAHKRERIVKTIKLACIYALSIMTLGMLIIQIMPEQILGIFNASEQMINIGTSALRIISIHFVIAAISIVFSSVFQALGHALKSMFVSIARQLVVLIPSAYLLSLTGNVSSVWWAFPIAEVASIIMCVCFFVHLYNKVIKHV